MTKKVKSVGSCYNCKWWDSHKYYCPKYETKSSPSDYCFGWKRKEGQVEKEGC